MKALLGVTVVIALGVSACSNGAAIDTARLESIALDPGLAQDSGEPMAEVLEYWALAGTLDSVGEEEGWLCPTRGNVGFGTAIEPSEIPQAFKLILPDRDPSLVLNRDSGPGCVQPHLLVMLAPADSDVGPQYVAGMTVWPQTTRFEDICGVGCSWGGGTVEEPTINGQPSRFQFGSDGHSDVWWFDTSGTPMYAETYGLPQDRVLDLIKSIAIEPDKHRATVDTEALGSLGVVSDQTSVGFWANGVSRSAVYDIDGKQISIDTRYEPTFDPRARFAPFIWTAELVDMQGTPAVWVDNGAGYAFFDFVTGGGIHVTISGVLTAVQAGALAAELE